MSRTNSVMVCAGMAPLFLALAACSSDRVSRNEPITPPPAAERAARDSIRASGRDSQIASPPVTSSRLKIADDQIPRDQHRLDPGPAIVAVRGIDLGAPIEHPAPPVTTPEPELSSSPPEGSGIRLARGQDAGGAIDSQDESTGEVGLPEALAGLRRELERQASLADQPTREYLLMAALAIVDPERGLEPEALAELPQRQRLLLAAYQEFSRRLGEEAAASGEEAALLRLLDDLRLAIEPPRPLTIAAAHFCTRVDGFGKYETFDRNAFLAGRAQQVVIYSEIEGFISAQNEGGMWETDLWQELAIHDSAENDSADDDSAAVDHPVAADDNVADAADAAPLWQQDWQPAPDLAARKRTDFFISYVVTLPDLPVGNYTMTVRVKDEAAGAIAEAEIPFSIVADANLAATIPE